MIFNSGLKLQFGPRHTPQHLIRYFYSLVNTSADGNMNKRRRTGPPIESATDRQKVKALIALYAANHAENTEEIKQLGLWQLTLPRSKLTEQRRKDAASLQPPRWHTRVPITRNTLARDSQGPFLFRHPITFDLSDLRQFILWFLLDIELRFSYIWFTPKRVPKI